MQISDEVIKILEYLCSKMGVTIDWTSNNILPYVEELCEKFIAWEISTSYAWIGIMVVATIISLIFTIIIHNVSDWGGVEWFLFACIIGIALMVCGTQIFDIIECNTFPEKAIYDYIQFNLK